MFETIRKIVAEQLGLEETAITEESSLKDDLGADSLDLFSIIMALEDEFQITIPGEELNDVTNIKELIQYLEGRGITKA
ncbi:MAG: acyl carrier protein [Lachnospiraceae bacterium]|nr:acyl carrier protein [Lachnospiraceae bacterium]